MHFRPIFSIILRPFYSKALTAKANDLNEKIAFHETMREQYTTRLVTARSAKVDLANVDFKKLEKQNEPHTLVELLQDELDLRRQWDALAIEVREAMTTEADAAYARSEEVVQDVRNRLESIGFLHFPEGGLPARGMWIPDMVNRHPEVLDARQHAEQLRTQAGDNAQDRHNDEAMNVVERELSRKRDRALGIPEGTGLPPAAVETSQRAVGI